MATAELRTVDDPNPGASPAEAPARSFPLHRLTVERYERMVDRGVFGEDEPVFLWHGRLVEKMTKGRRHAYSLIKVAKRLDRLVPDGWFTEQEGPMALSDDSMPEPDLKVIRGVPEDYLERAPAARDVALVVEVADSSLAVDSGEVLEAYAREAIPVYWLVNIPGRRIEVYSSPAGSRYGEHRNYGPGEEVPVVLDGREVGRIAVDDILP